MLPVSLPNGMIAVYGWGSQTSASGIIPTNTRFVFGNVYQVWSGGEMFVYQGDNVMWDGGGSPNNPEVLGDAYCKLTYSGNPYTIVPARLVTKTIVPP